MPTDGIPSLTFDNTSNRIVTTSGFQYDYDGNQTRALADDGVTWVKYTYDAANRLQSIEKDDANHTLLQAFQFGSTNAHLIDYDATAGVNTFICSVGGTTLAEYVEYAQFTFTWKKLNTYLGDSQLSTIANVSGSESTEYDHPDRLGTKVVTNQQSGTSYEQTHLPFGKGLAAESTGSTTKRFTSYERSAPTGLDYAVNRTYDSKQGRFAQVDPIGMGSVSPSNPQSLNLYSYCGNDPLNHTDPSGLFWGKLFHWIAKAFKWVMLAVTVAVAVLTVVGTFLTPFAMAAFTHTLLGQALTFLAGIPAAIGNFVSGVAGAIGGIFSFTAEGISAGLIGSGILAAGSSAGAIANSFAQNGSKPKKKKNLTPDQILQRVDTLVQAALKKKPCRDYITEKGDSMLSKDPRVTWARFMNKTENYRLINEGKYSDNPNQIAGGNIINEGGVRKPTIELYKPFFSDKLVVTTNPGALKGLSKFKIKALDILHELKHVYFGGDAAEHDQPGGWNDKLLKKCF